MRLLCIEVEIFSVDVEIVLESEVGLIVVVCNINSVISGAVEDIITELFIEKITFLFVDIANVEFEIAGDVIKVVFIDSVTTPVVV